MGVLSVAVECGSGERRGGEGGGGGGLMGGSCRGVEGARCCCGIDGGGALVWGGHFAVGEDPG